MRGFQHGRRGSAGVLLLPLTGLVVVGSPLGGRVAARTGPRPPIAFWLAAMATRLAPRQMNAA
jgi:hypothetical protein